MTKDNYFQKEREKSLEDLTRVCRNIINLCKTSYSGLWDQKDIWNNRDNERRIDLGLLLAKGFLAQEEPYFSVYLRKEVDSFVFDGQNFDYCGKRGSELNVEEAASRMLELGLTAESLRRSFMSSIKGPLGKYLAKKSLEKLGLGGENS